MKLMKQHPQNLLFEGCRVKLNFSVEEFKERYPFEECVAEDYIELRETEDGVFVEQFVFKFPSGFPSGAGQELIFRNNGVNTYFIIEDETPRYWPRDIGVYFVHRGKLYRDIELYEFVTEFFKFMIVGEYDPTVNNNFWEQ